jgi:uncharacterized protein YecT (DUF1311 family)
MKIFPQFLIFLCSLMAIIQTTLVFADVSDWQEEMDKQAAVVKEQCDGLVNVTYPSSDKPNSSQKVTLQGCDPDTLYYGLDGKKIDYVQARLCALSTPSPQDYSSSVLMMVYANGQGVKRNYKLAKKAACDVEGAPAEIQSRIQHLLDMETGKKGANSKIDICDDITSGFMMGYCSSLDSNLKEQIREQKFNEISSRWTDEEKAGFKILMSKANKFFTERSESEVDQSGTARAAMSIAEYTALREDFSNSLSDFESGKLPAFTQKDFTVADRKLNRTYGKLKKDKAEDDLNTVKMEDIQRVEYIWISYRDAWVDFGKLKYPSIPDYAWKTYFTNKRTKMLSDAEM